ncbi:hypothetical protein RZN22_03165 [Bacillaceae bacterium S4-13-58]
MKKILSALIVMILFTTITLMPFSEVQASSTATNVSSVNLEELSRIYEETKAGTDIFETTNEIKDLDGSTLEIINSKITKTVTKNDKKGKATIILLEEKTFTKPNGKEKTTTEKTKISYNKNGEFYINGRAIDLNVLTEKIYPQPIDTKIYESLEVKPLEEATTDMQAVLYSSYLSSGGVSWLTYYRETSSNYYYLKAYKEPTNWALDGGSGTPRVRYSYGSYKVTDFKNLARVVAGARNDIAIATASLLSSLGVAVLGWWTVIALLGTGTAAAISAYTLYSASKTGKAAMKEAYYLLGGI